MGKVQKAQQAVFVNNAGYRQNEYLVILNPHEELRKKILSVKADYSEKFNAPSAKWGKCHLALVRFRQLEMAEQRIINHLKLVGMGFCPIKVELRDFGSYPTHTIFINVPTKQPIKALVQQIKSRQNLLKLNDDFKPHFMDDPFITVARQLKPWQYEMAWPEYRQKSFTGRFIADGMLLLKRRVGEKAYQIAGRFEFENLPVNTKQGGLFE